LGKEGRRKGQMKRAADGRLVAREKSVIKPRRVYIYIGGRALEEPGELD